MIVRCLFYAEFEGLWGVRVDGVPLFWPMITFRIAPTRPPSCRDCLIQSMTAKQPPPYKYLAAGRKSDLKVRRLLLRSLSLSGRSRVICLSSLFQLGSKTRIFRFRTGLLSQLTRSAIFGRSSRSGTMTSFPNSRCCSMKTETRIPFRGEKSPGCFLFPVQVRPFHSSTPSTPHRRAPVTLTAF